MNNTTHSVKAKEIERKWYIIDAADKPLGRIATEVARLLKGKHKPTYSTHLDCGDFVIVINSDKIVLTGNKLNDKYYRHHSGYMTGLKEINYKDLMAKSSDKATTAPPPLFEMSIITSLIGASVWAALYSLIL